MGFTFDPDYALRSPGKVAGRTPQAAKHPGDLSALEGAATGRVRWRAFTAPLGLLTGRPGEHVAAPSSALNDTEDDLVGALTGSPAGRPAFQRMHEASSVSLSASCRAAASPGRIPHAPHPPGAKDALAFMVAPVRRGPS